jgi:hypothetical protein
MLVKPNFRHASTTAKVSTARLRAPALSEETFLAARFFGIS